MNDALYIAATGMQVQQLNVDTIANNLANVNTPGFKKSQVNFQDLVYRELGQTLSADGTTTAPGMSEGSGVGMASLAKVFTAGDLKKTDNPLDVAVQGSGFFEVTMPDGTRAYSRGGSLQVNKDGFLATSEGYALKPGIHIGNDVQQIAINPDGTVMVTAKAGQAPFEAGRLELSGFSDTSGLVPIGGNLYKSSEKSGDAILARPGDSEFGTVAQGYVEASNVQMVDEMVNLMVAQRAYEMSVKVIQASDEMLAMSNNLRR